MKSIFSDPFLTDSDRASVEELPGTSPLDTPTPPRVSLESFLPKALLPKAVEAAPSAPFNPPPMPSPASGALRNDDDPMALMRKIMMGGQVEELQAKLQSAEMQIKRLQEECQSKCDALESTLRAELNRTVEASKEALRTQSETLTQKFETAQAEMVSGMDERFRKLSAASIPRSHLAEIFKDVSSRLNAI